MKVILYKDENQNVLICYPVLDADRLKSELNGIFVDSESINIEYIDAYEINEGNLSFNLEKARDIKVEKIRNQRDSAFIDFDKRYDIAIKDEIDLADLKAERQKLKNAPEKAEKYLNSCINIEEIVDLNLSDLI